mgnify:CR=1 FL=1
MSLHRPFIVAEIGASHKGSLNEALRLVDVAKRVGADGVKFQTYTAKEISADVMLKSGPWAGRSYHALYAEGETPWEWHEILFARARALGLIPFSSPFSEAAVKRLETLNCPIYKIASPEIVHLKLIAAAARTHKSLIISTGMASKKEIIRAHDTAVTNGAKDIVFLHCLSAYPAEAKDFNLCTMQELKDSGLRIGLSDHSLSPIPAMLATAMGAEMIEKHLTLSRADGGIDAAFSLEPTEFAAMVKACHMAADMVGAVPFLRPASEATSRQYRRSIWLVKPVHAGEILTEEHLAILRPDYGVEPHCWDKLIGKEVNTDLVANTPMSWTYLK